MSVTESYPDMIDLLSKNVQITFLKGRRTISRPAHGGWFTPPTIHLLNVCEGQFAFKHPGSRDEVVNSGQCIVVMPGTRYFVRVRRPAVAGIRYAHVDVSFFGTLGLSELCAMPVIIENPFAEKIGDTIESIGDIREGFSQDLLSDITRYRKCHEELLSCLLHHATLTDHGRETLLGMQRLGPVLQFIKQNLTNPLSRDDIARVAFLSPTRLSVVFKNHLGCAPMQYVRRLRLNAARLDLIFDRITVAEAAYRYCFADPFHFSKSFKQFFGYSPMTIKSSNRIR